MQHNNPDFSLVYCKSCGVENFSMATFCNGCGDPLDGEEPAGPQLDLPGGEVTVRARRAGSFRQARKWEAISGLALLALVLAYVLYDWRSTSVQSDAYYSGLTAERASNWDDALRFFSTAGDRIDAGPHKELARRQIEQRDRFYTRASRAFDGGDWTGVILALQEVAAIAPKYSDTEGRLALAREHLLAAGLDGIAYLVRYGAPGLYVRNALGEALRLPGSDGRSTVHTSSSDGTMLVYDRPAVQGDLPFAPANGGSGFPLQRASRMLVLAVLGEGKSSPLTTQTLPQFDPQGRGVLSRKGLWWVSTQPGNGTLNYEVYYYDHLSHDPAAVIKVSNVMSGTRVLDIDPVAGKLIIGEPVGGWPNSVESTNLYLASARGDDRRLLQTATGNVTRSSFSAGGQWLLYETQINSMELTRSIWLLPLDRSSSGAPVPARELDTLTWSGVQADAHLSASFLPGSGPGWAVVSKSSGGIESLEVYGRDGDTPLGIWTERSNGLVRADLSTLSHDGKYVASRQTREKGSVLQVLELAGLAGKATSMPLAVRDSQGVRLHFSPRDDYILAHVQNPAGVDRGTSQPVYVFKLERGKAGEPRLLATASMPYDDELNTIVMPGEGSLMAYVDPEGDLHAMLYNGQIDLPVASGVVAVWNLRQTDSALWWR